MSTIRSRSQPKVQRSGAAECLSGNEGLWFNHARYDNLGNMIAARDPNANVTTYNYSDVCDANPPAGGILYAFATQVTDALTRVTKYGYDCATGNPMHAIDPNIANYNTANGVSANAVAASYDDPFERVSNVTRAQHVAADETQTAYFYSPTTVTTHSDLANPGDGTIVREDVVDGLGRHTAHYEQFGGSVIAVNQFYDALGRPFQTSNPYQANTETPYYTTTYFDALDRVTQVVSADGAAVTTSYTNNSVTVTDATGHTRTQLYDALGRLISVTANPGGINAVTSYTYDALDDLTSVTQAGLATGCSGYSRYFQYDWAKRLLSACNAESGTVTYTYDAGSNLKQKTDARGGAITYGYL